MKIGFLLNKDKLNALSEIVADAGQVFFAATVVPFLFGLDRINALVLISGLALTFTCWVASVILKKG